MHKRILFVMISALVLISYGGSASAAAKKPAHPTPTPAPVKVAVAPKEAPKPEPKTVEVQSGDSLSTIAQAQGLETWRPIWNVNPDLANPDLIYPGQKLILPDGPTTDRPLPEGVVVEALAPVAKPVAVTSHTAANYAGGVGGILQRVRLRESGGNYAINTGNGYYGAYQFNLSTWRGVGGSGLPSEASPAEQDMRAQLLFDRRGCSPWPNTCY